jgi:hypothetical protein
MIGVRDLVKDFRTPKRHPGLLGSLRVGADRAVH